MTAFYNERDPYAAAWLRNLISAGHIAPGIVDERDIRDILPTDLDGFTQCHFFAGIGVWSHAIRAAGWADDRPIWTGSCPCQPFSNAGQRAGVDDERHLWPAFFHLIEERRPPIVVGGQVASKDGLGWLDLVSADLEATHYAFGATDLCAAGFSGAHIRQRLYFVGLADSPSEQHYRRGDIGPGGWLKHSVGSGTGRLADADDAGSQGWDGVPKCADQRAAGPLGLADSVGHASAPMLGRNPADWLYCRDGKWRPVEPGSFPLVDETSSRVGRLRAYGNALDAETAQGFISEVMAIADGFEAHLDSLDTLDLIG
jgi:DNA (cytosine-5)-methyltransferase 1